MTYDSFDLIMILITGLFIGYLFNDMRRDLKEIKKDLYEKDKEKSESK